MVDTEAVQDGRVEVAQVRGVLGDVIAELIRGAVLVAGLHAAAGEPDGEGTAVVVAPGARVAEATLAERRAAELGREDHQRVLEHAARLQVLDQGGGRLVDVVALVGQLTREGDVLVPAAVEELDEADVAFEQAAG